MKDNSQNLKGQCSDLQQQNVNLSQILEELELNNKSLVRMLDSKNCREAQEYSDHVQSVLKRPRSVGRNHAQLGTAALRHFADVKGESFSLVQYNSIKSSQPSGTGNAAPAESDFFAMSRNRRFRSIVPPSTKEKEEKDLTCMPLKQSD